MRPAIEVWRDAVRNAARADMGNPISLVEHMIATIKEWDGAAKLPQEELRLAVLSEVGQALRNHANKAADTIERQAALIEADRLAVVAEIVAELRELALSFNAEDCADHIEAKFGGNNGDR